MSKRGWAWAGLITLALVSVVGGVFLIFGGSHTIRLSQEDIQERINKQLPKTWNDITVTEASVNLAETMTVHATMGGEKFNRRFDLSGTAEGEIVYRKGAFYFEPISITVEQFTYQGNTIAGGLKNTLDRYLDDGKLKDALERGTDNVEKWATETAQSATKFLLDFIPIYRVKDDFKGFLIKASLESVSVEDGKLAITFSLYRLTINVIILFVVLLAAIGLMIALVRNPGWLLTGAVISSFGDL